MRGLIDRLLAFSHDVSADFGDSIKAWDLDEAQVARLDELLTGVISELWAADDPPPKPRRRHTFSLDGIRGIFEGLGAGFGEAVVRHIGP
jgi:hypothetical protein